MLVMILTSRLHGCSLIFLRPALLTFVHGENDLRKLLHSWISCLGVIQKLLNWISQDMARPDGLIRHCFVNTPSCSLLLCLSSF